MYNFCHPKRILPFLIVPLILLASITEGDEALYAKAPLRVLTETSVLHPVSFSPVLTWEKNVNATHYEIEFFREPPAACYPDAASAEAVWRSDEIYANSYNPPLFLFAADALGRAPLYWRVRALDFDGTPVSLFSALLPLYTSAAVTPLVMTVPLPIVSSELTAPLLYPVYHWIRPYSARVFEVALYRENPVENPATEPIDTMQTEYSEVYDQKPRIGEGFFYWRVRSLDEDGAPLSDWSPAVQFRNDPRDSWKIAVFGDSISHGGGHISYGPADHEFSWLSYLDFPAINLSMSGDTSETMLDRFEDDVLPFRPRYLLIMNGTNSLRAGISAAEVIADLEELKRLCLENGIRPIFLTLPPINPENIARTFDEPTVDDWQLQFALVNDFLRKEIHIDVAAAFSAQPLLPTELGLDGLHEDVLGKQLIAQSVNRAWQDAKQKADRLPLP